MVKSILQLEKLSCHNSYDKLNQRKKLMFNHI